MKATEIIKRDHRAAEDLFEQYKKANEDAREAMEKKIFEALDAHEKMEDDYFYPALKDSLDDDEMFKELEHEQTELKMGVAALKLMPFIDRTEPIKKTMEKVLAHAKKEESYVLPKAEEIMSANQLEQLGAQMEPESAVAQAG